MCVFETVGLGEVIFMWAMQFPVVLAAAIPMIKQFLSRYSCDGNCACVQNLIKENWEVKFCMNECDKICLCCNRTDWVQTLESGLHWNASRSQTTLTINKTLFDWDVLVNCNEYDKICWGKCINMMGSVWMCETRLGVKKPSQEYAERQLVKIWKLKLFVLRLQWNMISCKYLSLNALNNARQKH